MESGRNREESSGKVKQSTVEEGFGMGEEDVGSALDEGGKHKDGLAECCV